MSKKAIFLDRDGVLNEDSGYVHKIIKLVLLPGVISGLKKLKDLNFLLIIITNQSGIHRGIFSERQMHLFHEALENKIGIHFDAIYYCPHTESEDCPCRKPKIHNILAAQKEFGIDLKGSYFIGDSQKDISCGKNAGCTTVWIKNDQYPITTPADLTVTSIEDFANLLI